MWRGGGARGGGRLESAFAVYEEVTRPFEMHYHWLWLLLKPRVLKAVRRFTVVVEQDFETGLFVGYVPGFPGAHSQATSLDELSENLREVIAMLLEDGLPELEAEFAGIQTITA